MINEYADVTNREQAEELYAATVRFRAKQNTGSGPEVYGFSASDIRELSAELKCTQVLLYRRQRCITQISFKVADQFGLPM
jgi:hypothetical protein